MRGKQVRQWIGGAIGAGLLVATTALFVLMLREASGEPVVRRAQVKAAGWPRGAAPVRIAALSDIHAGWPDATPIRLEALVADVQAQKPDLIVITGDFISHKFPGRTDPKVALAPLRGLHAPLGVIAVPGNHEHRYGFRSVIVALRDMGIPVLANEAVRRGPLAVIGVDDVGTQHDDIAKAFAAARRVGGVRIVLTHSPVILPWIPQDIGLFLSGHTHCGQVVLPWVGAIGARQASPVKCGYARYRAVPAIVGAGIGTSVVPLRLNAPPDWWLVTIGPR
jgi:predicted MPP superfamily phosphohydrolase